MDGKSFQDVVFDLATSRPVGAVSVAELDVLNQHLCIMRLPSFIVCAQMGWKLESGAGAGVDCGAAHCHVLIEAANLWIKS